MKISFGKYLASFALVFVVGQAATNHTRDVGKGIACFLELPAGKFQIEPFARVDFTITVPKDSSGAPYLAYEPTLTKDFALAGGKFSVTQSAPDTLTGSWVTAADGQYAGQVGQIVFRCDRIGANVAPSLTVTAKNAAGGTVAMDALPSDTVTIVGARPRAVLKFGVQQ